MIINNNGLLPHTPLQTTLLLQITSLRYFIIETGIRISSLLTYLSSCSLQRSSSSTNIIDYA